MIFLIFAILFSTSLNILFKLSERNNCNRVAICFFNFLGATIISLLIILKQILFDPTYFPSFLAGLGQASTPYLLILLIGFINGFLYFGAFFILQYSTAHNGSAMTATFNKLGVMVPAILSIIFFHEIPKFLQILGVVAAILAIVIIYFKKEEDSVVTMRKALIGTFLFGGLADFTSKIYQVYGIEKYQSMFIFFTFLFSLLLTGTFMLLKDRNMGKKDAIFGFIAGIPSQLISLFLLRALTTIPAFVVFPLYSVGVILVVNMINAFYFKEKLTRRQFIAIGTIVMAVILFNI